MQFHVNSFTLEFASSLTILLFLFFYSKVITNYFLKLSPLENREEGKMIIYATSVDMKHFPTRVFEIIE